MNANEIARLADLLERLKAALNKEEFQVLVVDSSPGGNRYNITILDKKGLGTKARSLQEKEDDSENA